MGSNSCDDLSGENETRGEHLLTGADFGERSRGQIGASTIIVLIAFLLVAASTAAILFNVTGLLESQAETTEQSVNAETNDALRSVAMTGRVDQASDPPTLSEVRVIVTIEDRSSSVDLGDAIVRLETPEGIDTLAYDSDGPVAGETFGVEALSDADGSAPTLTNGSDRFAVRMIPSALTAHDRVVVRIHLESGSTEVVYGRVPTNVRNEVAVTLS